ncbi:uncharacterized protein METZ01_LOCUS473911, partial [marine metagenome]
MILTRGNNRRHRRISSYIRGCPTHIQNPIDTENQSDASNWYADGFKDN